MICSRDDLRPSEPMRTEVEVARIDGSLDLVFVHGWITGRPRRLAFVDIGEQGDRVRVRAIQRSQSVGVRHECAQHGVQVAPCRHVTSALAAWDHVQQIEATEAAATAAHQTQENNA